jgi:alpha-methylacyl-CoA racemase
MPGPLNGVRVLELGGIGPTPFCGVVLADMGADVVRVERSAANGADALPAAFDVYNRNKRSVALDLKRVEGRRAALRLAAAADVLIEGFRPGVTERLGLGPAECLAENPRLVYGRMTGWGQDGPLAQAAGHDIDYAALAGALHCIGNAGQSPAPPLNLVADLGGGAMYLAVGVLAGLHEAKRSGRGQVVDAAMVDGVVNLMSLFYAFRQQGQWSDQRGDNLIDGGAPYYGTYRTRDGKYVAVGASEPQFYRVLVEALGLAAQDLPDRNDRTAWPALRQRFAAAFEARTRDEWVTLMDGREACFAPVLDLDEAPAHPHLRFRRVFQTFEGMLQPSPAPRFDRTPSELRRPPPRPGQHGGEVLVEWGLSPGDVRALREGGALQEEGSTLESRNSRRSTP